MDENVRTAHLVEGTTFNQQTINSNPGRGSCGKKVFGKFQPKLLAQYVSLRFPDLNMVDCDGVSYSK